MTVKRSSLFSIPAAAPSAPTVETPAPTRVSVAPPAAPEPELQARKYPVAKTREGKRVATVYLEKEALRQLQKLAFDEETTIQALLTEGVNSVFAARGLSRIA
jgi:hypothetical protein